MNIFGFRVGTFGTSGEFIEAFGVNIEDDTLSFDIEDLALNIDDDNITIEIGDC
jgi:hypothetical protein